MAKIAKLIAATSAFALLLFPTTASATDTELPVVEPNSGQFNASTYYPGDSVTASFRITDDVGCCDWTGMGLYTAAGQNVNSGNIVWSITPGFNRISGTATDGRYSYTVQIPANTAPGTYYVKVQANDIATRYTHLEQIGSIAVISPPTNSGGSSSSSNSGSASGPSASTSGSQGSLTVGIKQVVTRATVLSNLNITKGRGDKITYSISRASRNVCSLSKAGIKAKRAGTCVVTVNKTDSKRKKSKSSISITFTN